MGGVARFLESFHTFLTSIRRVLSAMASSFCDFPSYFKEGEEGKDIIIMISSVAIWLTLLKSLVHPQNHVSIVLLHKEPHTFSPFLCLTTL